MGEQAGQGLFSLRDFDNTQELQTFADSKCTVLLPNKFKAKKLRSFSEKYADSDEELEVAEARLNALYQRYKKNHGLKTQKETRQVIKDGMGLQSDSDFNSDSQSHSDSNIEADDENETMDIDENVVSENEEGGGLVVKEKEFVIKEDSKMTKAKRWFSDNIFDSIETDKNLDAQQMNQEFGDLIADKDDDETFEIVSDAKKIKKTKTPSDENSEKKPFKYKDLPEILK